MSAATLEAMNAERVRIESHLGREPANDAHLRRQLDELRGRMREMACETLAEREGTPDEHLEHCSTPALVEAALAPEGQPCGDCGAVVVWTDDREWRHAEPSGCFLAQGEEW
jgi:hypothetical protein